MISIVCVFNDRRKLTKSLLHSLEAQNTKYELILLDNTKNKFKSAAQAWNYGGEKTKGDFIMFVHQDIWLSSTSWLRDTEKILISLKNLGTAGVAGMSESGRNWEERSRWSISRFIMKTRNRVQNVEEVQTLDNCLIIVPKSIFNNLKFDQDLFNGWDCYGADYCLNVKKLGLKNYVIPLECSHSCLMRRTSAMEMKILNKFQRKLYNKHKKNFKRIYTWLGKISRVKIIKQILWEFIMPHFSKIFPDYIYSVKRELKNCKSVLNLGCGPFTPFNKPYIPASVGVDLYKPYILESDRIGIHGQLVQGDLRELEFKPNSFDIVLASEVLEHLSKREGEVLLNKMELWARKKVIITTPNGYIKQITYDDNILQKHRSGWTVEDFRRNNFKVHGLMGWKDLREERGLIRFNPKSVWERISIQSQKIIYFFPKFAFQLYAVKNISS